jgi:hypothetical protein
MCGEKAAGNVMGVAMRNAYGILSAVVVLFAAQVASADEVTFSGSSGTLSAEATFSLTGNTLTVTLTNTSGTDALVPTDILTGVFFSAPVSGTTGTALTSGTVYGYPGLTNVGGEWAYESGFSGPNGTNQGISATGLGLFGPDDRFDTTANYVDNENVGGVDGGLAPAGDNPATGNGGITNQGLINNSVTFTLTGWTGVLADITGIWFQYGTDLSEPGFGGGQTPEPATAILLGFGAAGLWYARRRKQAAA